MTGQVFRYGIAHGIATRSPARDIRPGNILKSTRKSNYARIEARDLPHTTGDRNLNIIDPPVDSIQEFRVQAASYDRSTAHLGRCGQYGDEERHKELPWSWI